MLSKLAYLMLCRSIQVLVLLVRGDTAKDLEILVLRHQLAVLRPQAPGWSRLIGPCSPRQPGAAPSPVGRASSCNPTHGCAGTDGWSPAPGPTRTARPAGHRWTGRSDSPWVLWRLQCLEGRMESWQTTTTLTLPAALPARAA
jgi:hypothetical protein